MISQPNCHVHHLHAANSWMTTRGTDAILQVLSINSSLHTLDVKGNNIKNGKQLGVVLKNHAVLEWLVLNVKCLGDTGVHDYLHAFTDNHVLTKLGLGTNMIGVAGIMSILSILPQLTQLSLEGSKFGDDGAKLIPDKLKGNTRLISFSCHSCSLTHTGNNVLWIPCIKIQPWEFF